MRITLTLADDVAARLQAEALRSGRPFGTVVNQHLRATLAQRSAIKTLPPFRVQPRNMGGPLPGLSYDNVGTLLEDVWDTRRG
jgi:hypothetical protein